LLAQLFSAYLGSRIFTNFAQFAAVSPTSIRQHVTVALFVLQLALLPMMAIASDADPEQDFCVADPNNPTIVNGLVCKNPALVNGTDFMSTLLATPGNTNNPLGSMVTAAAAGQFPGINTLGISMARLDFAKGGLVPPHTHPRATEIIFVVEGSLLVGFVSTNETLFATTLQKGDVFVFPRGLLHFEFNVCDGTATAIAALNSQNPGTQIQAVALFNSGISEAVLEKAFGLGEKAVQKIEYAVEAANGLAQHGLVLWPCRMFHAYAQLFEIPTDEDCWETQYWAQVNRLPTNILLATNFPRDIHQ
jgi:quercetin dioxygenase-like cupin family protein